MIKCDKIRCIGNLNGECVNDRCKGAIISIHLNHCNDKETRRKYYEAIRKTFNEDFENTPDTTRR